MRRLLFAAVLIITVIGCTPATPTPTATPTLIPTLPPFPTITKTPTSTYTSTSSPTPRPLCTNVTLDSAASSVQLGYLDLVIKNNNPAPVYLAGGTIKWNQVSKQPGMYLDHFYIGAAFNAWSYVNSGSLSPGLGMGSYTIPSPSPNGEQGNGWAHANSPYYLQRNFAANATSHLKIYFANYSVPNDLRESFNFPDFVGTQIVIDLTGNGAPYSCVLTLNGPTPTPHPTYHPTATPTATSSLF